MCIRDSVRTGCDIQPETVAQLSELDNIVGIKEASTDPTRLASLIEALGSTKAKDSFLLYSGDDISACKFLLGGGHGTISVTANVIPEIISRICNLASNNLLDKALEEDNRIATLHEALFVETSPIPVKWVLNRLGRIPTGIRLPLTNLDSKYHSDMELMLKRLGLLN